jgi:hypothetical protein
MNLSIRTVLVGLAVLSVAVAATPKQSKRLTVQRVAELTAPADAPVPKAYKVKIAGLGNAVLPAAKPSGGIRTGREVHFPTEFDPPRAPANGAPVITPTTPTAFETIDTGWSVRLTARPQGQLIAVYGVADYTEAELVPGGYGAIAGPIYTERGDVLTLNKLDEPKLQTTTTRFHIFAVAGEPYEVTFYRGAKRERHVVTVWIE